MYNRLIFHRHGTCPANRFLPEQKACPQLLCLSLHREAFGLVGASIGVVLEDVRQWRSRMVRVESVVQEPAHKVKLTEMQRVCHDADCIQVRRTGFSLQSTANGCFPERHLRLFGLHSIAPTNGGISAECSSEVLHLGFRLLTALGWLCQKPANGLTPF